jgi:hypothetical protein
MYQRRRSPIKSRGKNIDGTVSVLSCIEEKIQVPVAGSRSTGTNTNTDRQEFGYDSIDCMAMYFHNMIMQNVRTSPTKAKASESRANFIFLIIVESREAL